MSEIAFVWRSEHPSLGKVARLSVKDFGGCADARAEVSERHDCWRVHVNMTTQFATLSGNGRFSKETTETEARKWCESWITENIKHLQAFE